MIPALQQAATDPDMRSGGRLAVYLYLCTQLDIEQFRAIKISGHAHALGIERETLSRALKHLIGAGYVESKPDGDDRRRHIYRLYYSRKTVTLPSRNRAA